MTLKRFQVKALIHPIRNVMIRGFFILITVAWMTFPLQNSFAGEGTDLRGLSQAECLRRVWKILEPSDLKKFTMSDLQDDLDLFGKIMLKQTSGDGGNSNWVKRRLPEYLAQQFSIDGMPQTYSVLTAEERGWHFLQITPIDESKALLRVKHASGEIRNLEVVWPEAKALSEEWAIQQKFRFQTPPKPRIREIQDRARDALRKKNPDLARALEFPIMGNRQVARGAEAFPEHFASLVAKAAKDQLPLEKTIGIQEAYFDSLTSPEIVSLVQKGDRTEFSMRLLTSRQKYSSGGERWLDGKMTSSARVHQREVTLNYFPENKRKMIDVDHQFETQYFIRQMNPEHTQPYAVGLKFGAKSRPLELHYLNMKRLNEVLTDRANTLDHVSKVSDTRLKQTFMSGLKEEPSPFYLEMPEQIRNYIANVYRDPKKGLAVNEPDLKKLLKFMKEAENRSEYISLYRPEGDQKNLVGTVSLVSSNHVDELLPVESILKKPGLVKRKGNLPVIEVSRFTLDFSTRKQFNSTQFLNVVYEIASNRPAEKIVAFCEDRFAQDVMAKSAFRASSDAFEFEGKKYLLLEATPAGLLKDAIHRAK